MCTVYNGVHHTSLERFSKLKCSTTKRVPVVPVPDKTSSKALGERTPTFLAPPLFPLRRYRAWKIGPGGGRYTSPYRYTVVPYALGVPGCLPEYGQTTRCVARVPQNRRSICRHILETILRRVGTHALPGILLLIVEL